MQNACKCGIFYLLLPMSTRRERAKAPVSQLNKQLTKAEMIENLRKIRSRKNLHTAEIYIDIAKLIFGGMVIGSLFGEKEYSIYLTIGGIIISLTLLGIGNVYFNKGNKDI